MNLQMLFSTETYSDCFSSDQQSKDIELTFIAKQKKLLTDFSFYK